MKKKVLLIEDNNESRLLEKDLLEVGGFEVFEAVDAQTGLELLYKEKPDVVLIDIKLPDLPGTDIAKKMRLDNTLDAVPIIFVTASVMPIDLKDLKAFRNSSLIAKPIDTRTFAKKISDTLK